MNKVMLVGYITAKPELKQTSNGIATTKFNVAVNRPFTGTDGKHEADFIPVRVWRKQAENICKYLDKGRLISVEGRLQTGTYQDKNGNKQYIWEVVANDVQFLNKNTQNNQNTVQSTLNNNNEMANTVQKDEQVDIYAEFGNEVDDNEFLD